MGDESGNLPEFLREFSVLKEGIGLEPRKMSRAKLIMAVMHESNGAAATQRLLDDLAELTGPDGTALAHALNIKAIGVDGETLSARRANTGLDPKTAMERERRAAVALYNLWSTLAGRRRRYGAKAVSKVFGSSFPVEAIQKMGDRSLQLVVLVHERLGPIINIETRGGSLPTADTLCVMNGVDQCVVTYTVDDNPWHLEVFTPPIPGDGLSVHRPDLTGVEFIRLELPDQNGVTQDVVIEPPALQHATWLSLELGMLTTPGAITWHRDQEPNALRPGIVYRRG